jgi:hypothetical protein
MMLGCVLWFPQPSWWLQPALDFDSGTTLVRARFVNFFELWWIFFFSYSHFSISSQDHLWNAITTSLHMAFLATMEERKKKQLEQNKVTLLKG